MEAPTDAGTQIAHKLIGAHGVTLPYIVGKNELGFAVQGDPNIGIAPLADLLATILPQCDTITQAFDLSRFR